MFIRETYKERRNNYNYEQKQKAAHNYGNIRFAMTLDSSPFQNIHKNVIWNHCTTIFGIRMFLLCLWAGQHKTFCWMKHILGLLVRIQHLANKQSSCSCASQNYHDGFKWRGMKYHQAHFRIAGTMLHQLAPFYHLRVPNLSQYWNGVVLILHEKYFKSSLKNSVNDHRILDQYVDEIIYWFFKKNN